jgi:hypothetical protein
LGQVVTAKDSRSNGSLGKLLGFSQERGAALGRVMMGLLG